MKSYILTQHERNIIDKYILDEDLTKTEKVQLANLIHRAYQYKTQHIVDSKLICSLLIKYESSPRRRRRKKGDT